MTPEEKTQERIAIARRRYESAMHAMQAAEGLILAGELRGVAPEAVIRTLKHMRVGVNSALMTCGTHTRLLIEKGIITELEYVEAVADDAEREAERARLDAIRRCGLPDSTVFG